MSQFCWSRLGGLPEIIPAPRAAALLALLAALLYAALAGFSLPTQRAVIMVGVVMRHCVGLADPAGTGAVSRHAAGSGVDPLAVLSAGWWLSFWAVTLILYVGSGRIGRQPVWRRWGHVHLVLAVSLLPVLLVSFQQASLVAPLANLIAVPWVSLLVIPVLCWGPCYCRQ